MPLADEDVFERTLCLVTLPIFSGWTSVYDDNKLFLKILFLPCDM